MTNHYTDVCEETIKSLRQQLAAKDAEIERLKTVPMKYRRMAFNAQLQNENTQLCQQLAAALAACKLKDEALKHIALIDLGRDTLPTDFCMNVLSVRKALAIHPNIDMDIDHLKGGN